jgi:hypothetical protein
MLIAGQPVDPQNYGAVVARLKGAPNPFDHPLANGASSGANITGATRVEQAQVGFSANKPIGTDQVGDCLVMIVRDPVSAKTALAHIDRYASGESLQKIFDGLPSDRRLDVVLLGASHDPDDASDKDGFAKNCAKGNLTKTIQFLADKNVNIIAAKVYDPKALDAFVVDPRSFEIKTGNTYPKKGPVTDIIADQMSNPDHELSYAKMMLSFDRNAPVDPKNPDNLGTRGLETAFDLTKSPTRNPVLLRSSDVAVLNEFKNTTDINNEDQVKAWAQRSNHNVQEFVAPRIAGWANAYDNAHEPLVTALYNKIVSLRDNGVTVTADQQNSIMRVLQSQPLYVGANAEAGNSKLRSFIQNDLFKPNADRTVAVDLAGLKNGNFTDNSPGALSIEANARTAPASTSRAAPSGPLLTPG